MKVLVMAGTRPEAIKVAPVVRELNKHSELTTVLCNTGQHKEMIQQAFDDFDLKPDLHLDVMQPDQTLASLSSRLFKMVGDVLLEQKPDCMLVQGDTTTVMVSAMCAFYQNIRVGHIEAGLRSFNRWAPFPEEVNRQTVSKVADLHFAPTKTAYANLVREGIDPDEVLVTGNTVIDSLHWIQEKIKGQRQLLDERVLEAQKQGQRIVLVTGHRRENLGDGFIEICNAVRQLADAYEDVAFVYPVHLNPKVQEPVMNILGNHPRIILTKPFSYKPFIAHLNAAYFVLTDSGGIQEEAPALGKPVLVMRDVTERPEGVKAGVSKLVGPHADLIVRHASLLLDNEEAYHSMAKAENPYGDGHASEKIVNALVNL
ncbi:UDP-N-acetylglucosamine 2-epimerase (non-hydrolyzing) [uncultured Desulfovibrio sp.]|uniref:non-hydrolyzing UDP-N-acetylglucosamine 2-epimerase n=1 Tax=uncultured Desulfovibrio sp. TaxID=167968 RepID=UPI00258D9AD4|nr:UDP-N-acetylglucosamine 2-epimerase (non-hydrolyzing) [uncultured Desulfovibrio sp.]